MQALRFPYLAVALAVALVACSGGGDKQPATTTTPDQPMSPPPTQPEQPATPPVPPKPAGPEIHAFTASENGFLVSSYAVVDSGEVLLVDAQLIKPDAEAFVAKVKGLGGTVKTIFITHAHPDHYLGLEWVSAAFPEAKIVAGASTVEDITKSGATTLGFLKSKKFAGGALKDLLPAKVMTPAVLEGEGTSIMVGKSKLEILVYPEAEARAQHVLWEPTTGSLIAGDLIYNNVHLWLKDKKPPGWIKALEDLKGRPEIKKVYPGHGEPGGPELFEANLTYLKAFEEAVKATKTQKELVAKVTQQFADYRLPVIVSLAAPTYKKKK